MGYFSNGTQGMDYGVRWCDHCTNQGDELSPTSCAVWDAHMLHNYDECNNPKSILHMLIPRDKDGCNQRCLMFRQAGASDEH